MIQPIATPTAPVALGEAPSTAPGSPFTALFAQALAGQLKKPDGGGDAILAMLLGDGEGLDRPVGTGPQVAPLSDDGADFALMAGLAVPIPPPVTSLSATAGAEPMKPAALSESSLGGGKSLPVKLAAIAARNMPDVLTKADPGAAMSKNGPANAGVSKEDGAISIDLPGALLAKLPSGPKSLLAEPTLPTSVSPEASAQAARAMQTGILPERPTLALTSTLGTANWNQELGDRLIWMSSRQGQLAELTLNPPSLGSVEVRLNLSAGGEAGAQFFSPHAAVREAIEAAMPKLREMMAAAGLSLGETTVSDQSFRQGQAEGEARPGNREATPRIGLSVIEIALSGGHGLVDFYV